MSIIHLPNELLAAILFNPTLSPADWYNIALVCTSWAEHLRAHMTHLGQLTYCSTNTPIAAEVCPSFIAWSNNSHDTTISIICNAPIVDVCEVSITGPQSQGDLAADPFEAAEWLTYEELISGIHSAISVAITITTCGEQITCRYVEGRIENIRTPDDTEPTRAFAKQFKCFMMRHIIPLVVNTFPSVLGGGSKKYYVPSEKLALMLTQ